LRMNVNGRLTAPPLPEVALVTNSVDGIVLEGGNDQPKTRGTTLAKRCFGFGSRTRIGRGTLRVGITARWFQRAALGALGLRKFDPVSATHRLPVARKAVAGN
jgi:hypothetical protein